ncbi:uncharacterized protein LOC132164904 [Corylus avellana]|uniref:uncharacterized protein LOC132164904 n=1 Tax=Corylus avellana TaxID=13451 RepID=UPI001E21BBC8|nr:uncharacterized protein LOC132164904 [Corylus avellana]
MVEYPFHCTCSCHTSVSHKRKTHNSPVSSITASKMRSWKAYCTRSTKYHHTTAPQKLQKDGQPRSFIAPQEVSWPLTEPLSQARTHGSVKQQSNMCVEDVELIYSWKKL